MGVGKQGQRVEVPVTQQAPAADGGNATEMLFSAPLEVPKTGPGSGQTSAPAEQAAGTSQPIAPVAKAFLGQGLHLTLFASGSEGHGYDGVIIERAPGKNGKAAPAVKPAAGVRPVAPGPATQPAAAGAPASKPAAQPAAAATAAPKP